MARSLTSGLLISAGVLMELCFLTFYLAPPGPGEVLLFIAVNGTTFLILSYLVWRFLREHVPAQRRLLLPIAAFGLLFRLTLLPHAVIGSDDIYRYLWDGKVAAAGINPFAFTPTDPHLSHLATVDLPSKVNHPELRSVYPALAQLLFGGLPARGGVLRVHARDEADRRPVLPGRARLHALLGLGHRRVRPTSTPMCG